jgi:hypothetical protein
MRNYHPWAKFHLQPPRKIGASRSLPKLLICHFTFTPHATRKSRQSNNEEQRGEPHSPCHSCHIVLIQKGSKTQREQVSRPLFFIIATMVGCPLSNKKKKQIARQSKDGLILCAVALYLHDQSKDLASKEKPLSIWKACKTIEDEHWRQTGKDVAIHWGKWPVSSVEYTLNIKWIYLKYVQHILKEYTVNIRRVCCAVCAAYPRWIYAAYVRQYP